MLLLLLAVTSAIASAFTGPAAFIASHPPRMPSALFAGDSDKDGGAAIAKPKVQTKQAVKTETRRKEKSKRRVRASDPTSRSDEKFEDAPLYKLMLLGDEEYDQAHVVERMCALLEDMDEDQASTIYSQAEISGKAMCGKYPYEHAEMYKEQLARSDPMIYSDLEEENKKN
eukprot:CAMPEP_0113525510 /NCGR_PEP_ID=MMETSP0015_2-20120614/205_1 /TAXON_ID=2838 /ORGANISM="Odontella" /LENGTH=170 /DNA_ID=CAMNT_0000423691 /DNA_START=365 /DNA_END=877 /DNA_ORIENTATION=- /assembly_acc=CAM_ASM_000160